MSAKKGLNRSNGFLASNPMAKYSDYAWTDGAPSSNVLGTSASSFLTTSDYSLMSRFALNSSLTLHSNADSDATNSSTSSISATINSSTSLPISPAVERETRTLNKAPMSSLGSNHHQTASNHLLQLQKEIKEEEEEIFADINSLINRRSYLFSSIDDGDEDDGINLDCEDHQTLFKLNPTLTNANTNTSLSLVGSLTNKTIFTNPETSATTTPKTKDPHDYFSLKADSSSTSTSTSTSSNPYQTIVDSFVRSSSCKSEDHADSPDRIEQKTNDTTSSFSQLKAGQQWQGDDSDQLLPETTLNEMGDESPGRERESQPESDPDYASEYPYTANGQPASEQDHQAFKAAMQQAASNLPKPCVFFLEGNCRRSDCKYSHDLSNITCKYWIEGFCFKGDLCPFLHSFTPLSNSRSDGLSDDEGLQAKKKELNPTFVIESEADFPSLPLDAPMPGLDDNGKSCIDVETITNTIKNQILSSNPAVVFKTIKKKRKRG